MNNRKLSPESIQSKIGYMDISATNHQDSTTYFYLLHKDFPLNPIGWKLDVDRLEKAAMEGEK